MSHRDETKVATGVVRAFDDQSQARRINYLAFCGTITVAFVSVILNLRINMITDVSWLITVIERMLDGQRLYVDVMESNPPFTIWLYFPVVAFGKVVGATPEAAILIYTYVLGLVSLAVSYLIALRGGLISQDTKWWLWPAIALIFFVLPGYAFSQREHIGLMLFLPLLVLQAWRLVEVPGNKVPLFVSLIAGLSGSIMVLIKPHWALAVLLPALYLAWKRRSLRQIIQPEYWVIGLLAVCYLAAVVVVYPEFLSSMYPMLKLLYLPIQNASGKWPSIVAICSLPITLWVLLRFRAPTHELADIAAIAGLGFFLAMVYLGKGWDYHLYPAIAAFLIASVVAFEAALRTKASKGTLFRFVPIWSALVVVSMGVGFHVYRGVDVELINAVRKYHPNPQITGVSGDIALGFPFTRLANGEWQSIYNCDWIGAHAQYRLRKEKGQLSHEERVRLENYLTEYVPIKIAELRSKKPDIVLELKSGAWSKLMRSNSEFNSVMSEYKLLAEAGGVAVWGREPQLVSAWE